jgi:proline iminopeptidase
MRRYFDPDRYMIVLFDQRGAGRSKPFAEIRENTTPLLVEDIDSLRRKLGVESMILFGGSWGSTLALAYAETYPERVSGLVLRGIFTATRKEIDHFYHGGAAVFYPDAYRQLLDSLPVPVTDSLPRYLVKLLTGNDNAVRKRAANAWLRYEWLISDVRVNRQEVEEWMRHNDAYAFSLIENHYMASGCFLEEGQLWKALPKIRHIPCVIINGRHDMPCPPVTAWELHLQWPGSKLVIVEEDGHFGPGIEKTLVEAMK